MLRRPLSGAFAVSTLALVAACTSTPAPPMAEAPKPMLEPWGYPLDAFDMSVQPGDDFYAYANGGWLARTDIPSDRSGTGFSIDMLDRNEARIAEIISDLSVATLPTGSEGQKIRDLYNDFMDVDRINALGMTPAKADIARIRSVRTADEVAALMAMPALGIGGPFAAYVTIDAKNPTTYTMGATHSGIGLPDRTYYLNNSAALEKTRAAYTDHLARMLTIAGVPDADVRAQRVFKLEKDIAQLHWSRAERRNADRTYNRMTVDELAAMAPGYPWKVAMAAEGLPTEGDIVVREKEAFAPLAKLFGSTPVVVWQDYMTAKYISSNASSLSDDVYTANFEFYGKALRGQEVPRERYKRGIALVNSRLDQAVGKEYIARYFPEESKRQMTVMVENIRDALAIRIDDLEWMSPATKVKAQAKLAAINPKIAYPEKWTDYAAYNVVPGDLYGNIKRHREWTSQRNVDRLGTTVDKREWNSPPQTVNAFYSPTRNEIFIPAGYIQSPLFDPNADPAINYGAIGSIVGHEIGHGFDDQGSKYGPDGKLESWWTDEDRAAFDALGDKLAAQFSEYEPLPGLNVNGRQTLGENIGDLAGVQLAYDAYVLLLDGEDSPVLDGFTGEQRVFLGRAQARRYKRTEESLRQRLLSAPHSPMNIRVNGMVRNIDDWYDAFSIDPSDEMYLSPDDRVRIW